MTHSIRQHHLHVEINGAETDALALQNRLPGWCQNWLFPALERTLDRCVPAAEHWSIDRLEIDAGVLGIERLEQDLPGLVEQALEKSLRMQLPAGTVATIAATSVAITQKSPPQHIDEAFVYFLKTGTLPWGLRLPEGNNLEQALLKVWQETPSSRHSGAVLAVFTLASARKRLVRQFSEAFLTTLLERIAPDLKKIMAGILQGLKSSGLPVDAIEPFATQLWETAFALLPTAGNYTETRIIRTAWQKLPVTLNQSSLLTSLLEHHWPGVTSDAGKKTDTTQRFPRQHTPISERKPSHHALLDTENTAGISPEPADADVSREEQANQHPDAGAGIYIENAGLVLLHPFLPRFFEALNIAAEDAIIQPERALCLLHFLTTGQRIAPEYELVLPKVLCNIPLTAPVKSGIDLTDPETEEAVALLEAVIRHWDVLKNTGIDGLRGTFLLRAGKITLQGDGDWRLQVESKAYDILLKHLPWGIGMIKLPWMQRMLWVEWGC